MLVEDRAWRAPGLGGKGEGAQRINSQPHLVASASIPMNMLLKKLPTFLKLGSNIPWGLFGCQYLLCPQAMVLILLYL